MLRPRESRELRLVSSQIGLTPDATLSWAHDVFGNAVATATFQNMASELEVNSLAEIQLDAVAWPIFDISVSMSYPFRYSDDEWLDLLVTHPDLIQRPIVEKGEKVILARPAESVKELLS